MSVSGPLPERRWTRRRSGCGCLSGLVSLALTLVLTVGAILLVNPGLSLSDLRAFAEGLIDSLASTEQVYTDPVDGQQGTGGTGYTFASTQPDGVSPVTWSCTGTIPIEVNPAGAPDGFGDVLDSSISRLNDASGFSFEIVGQTEDRTFADRSPGPVLVGFADAEEVDALAGQTAGLGGSVYVHRPGARIEAVGGMVVLDTDVFTESLPEAGAEAIVIHELAHVLGLGHTDTGGELMQPLITTQTDLGPGDRAGLQHLRSFACS